jgi:poly-gamma-glutamate synthesis protein (capsule biosynthesis protein)
MKYAISIPIFIFLSFFVVKFDDAFAPAYFQKLEQTKPAVTEKTVTVVAVGDIMLGRFVEELSLRNHNWNYPFASTSPIFSGADVVFGNFEGAVPKEHKKTPIYGYQFSVRKEAVEAAHRAGINAVTLANNHSYDFGASGYAETVSVLNRIGMATVGKNSDYVYGENGTEVRFMGWNDTFAKIFTSTFSENVRASKKQGEFLIAAVHFGEEYATSSNARQKEAAHALIDAGADVVIGHHPHAVQEMEMYSGKPIFYSLGNFIFDQYFSEETQKGLAIRMTIRKKDVKYELIPIDLYQSRPRVDTNVPSQSFALPR